MRIALVIASVLLAFGVSEGQAAVTVEATLSSFDPHWFWSINDENTHADGLGCRARFVLLTPAAHAGKEIEILFHSLPDEVRKSCPGFGTDIGSIYSFELPDDFFDKDYKLIYSYSVKKLKRGHTQPAEATSGTHTDDRERSPFEPAPDSVPE